MSDDSFRLAEIQARDGRWTRLVFENQDREVTRRLVVETPLNGHKFHDISGALFRIEGFTVTQR